MYSHEAECQEYFGIKVVQESQVSILWNCGLWAHHMVESRKGADILHGHDIKACQRVAYQLCRHNVGTRGEGRREPFSCSLNEADQ